MEGDCAVRHKAAAAERRLERGVGAGNDKIAGQRLAPADAGGRPLDGRQHRDRQAGNPGQHALQVAQPVGVLEQAVTTPLHIFHVATGREGKRAAGNDKGRGRLVVLGLREQVIELLPALQVERVARLLTVLMGSATGALLGFVFGQMAIRRQGIYFAMITLALAQMVFICLRAPFTGGEDGLQAVPRGDLFGLFSLADDMSMYYFVAVPFIAATLLM